jgi:hypothetical protein
LTSLPFLGEIRTNHRLLRHVKFSSFELDGAIFMMTSCLDDPSADLVDNGAMRIVKDCRASLAGLAVSD